MKILIDARLYGLENAGLGRYTINLIKQISNQKDGNQYILLLRKKYYEDLKLPDNFKKVLVDFRHYSLKEQLLLPGIIAREAPDLTHFLHFNVPLFFRKDFVVTIHDLLMHKKQDKAATTLPLPLYLLKRIGYKLVFDNAVHASRKIIVPTKVIREELLKKYSVPKEKISVIYEGVDPFWFKGNSDTKATLSKYNLNGEHYFIYAGNAYPHKNLRRAIEAVAELRKTNPDVIFAITCARGVFTQRLTKLVKQLEADSFVRLLGFVSDQELRTLYRGSVGFLYPSLSEGFGLPGLEAMAAGTLAVVSEIPVFKEVYQGQALFFNPYDFTSIAKTLKSALSLNNTERKKLITTGRKLTTSFSWQKMANETLLVYNSATG